MSELGHFNYISQFEFGKSMMRKNWKSKGLFEALSVIGGMASVLNATSVVVLSLILSSEFWRKEAKHILKDDGVEEPTETQVKDLKHKLASRFTFASLHGLYDATEHLSIQQ